MLKTAVCEESRQGTTSVVPTSRLFRLSSRLQPAVQYVPRIELENQALSGLANTLASSPLGRRTRPRGTILCGRALPSSMSLVAFVDDP